VPKLGLIDVACAVLVVSALTGAATWYFALSDPWQNLLIAWLTYKVVRRELSPRRAGRLGGFALFDENGRARVILGEPDGNCGGRWAAAISAGHPNTFVHLFAEDDTFVLAAGESGETSWGFLDWRSIDKMVELGILHRPGGDDDSGSEKPFPAPPTTRETKHKQLWTALVYVLAG